MRTWLLAGAVVCGALFVSAPSRAQDHVVFVNTTFASQPYATLTFDGVTPFSAIGTGWVSSTGQHLLGNTNYATGTGRGTGYNSFFTFALGALKPVSPYSSAVLTLQTGDSLGAPPFDISFFDVAASATDLQAGRAPGDTAGQAIYADLGSGAPYGSYVITAATAVGQTVAIPLNETFLAAVNNGLLTTFSIGGTLTPSDITAVPEPASLAMLGLGVTAIATLRRRRAP